LPSCAMRAINATRMKCNTKLFEDNAARMRNKDEEELREHET
jgi:hypothetical protein